MILKTLTGDLTGIIMGHLGRLKDYEPAHGRKVKLGSKELADRYRKDPVFSVFGLDSIEYISATMGGGVITSIHRKIGDLYEDCVRLIFMDAYGVREEDIDYIAKIRTGDTTTSRKLDCYVDLKKVPERFNPRVKSFVRRSLSIFSNKPKVKIIGLGFEIRHCYQSADSKRAQADEAMARHLIVSGILPVMLLFCDQSNENVVRRYRTTWVVSEGRESYVLLREFTGFNFLSYLKRNRAKFRKPVISLLRRIG